MNDHQLLKYNRHILLPQIDIEGQEKLLQSKALIIGAGGLGSPAAIYLVTAGIGEISLYDDDHVELSNLQRQIVHSYANIGKPKVISAKDRLLTLNPDTKINACHHRINEHLLDKAVPDHDIVLDCSDNFTTRFAINAACVKHKKPLISGAAVRFEGQITVFVPNQPDSPCYNCLYPNQGSDHENCAQNGVIAPLTGVIGSLQALETIKQLLNIGETLVSRLLLLDGLTMQWQVLRFKKNPQCPTCTA